MKIKSFKQFIAEEQELQFKTIKNRGDWMKLVQKARDKFNIFFDMENLDASSKGIHEYKTNGNTYLYEQWWSSGDWETPSILFCCENQEDNKSFVFIPNDEQGNPQLQKSEKGRLVPLDDQDKIKADEVLCLKSLKQYLDKL